MVWRVNIEPKLRNIWKSVTWFLTILFPILKAFWSFCHFGSILAKELNSFICKKCDFFYTPGTPWGASIVEWMVFESIRPLCLGVLIRLCWSSGYTGTIGSYGEREGGWKHSGSGLLSRDKSEACHDRCQNSYLGPKSFDKYGSRWRGFLVPPIIMIQL